MSDLRAAVETMPTARIISQWDLISRKAVLALIPDGAVLVTEESLTQALYSFHSWPGETARAEARDILANLREMP